MNAKSLTLRHLRKIIFACAFAGLTSSLFASSTSEKSTQSADSVENNNRLVLAAKYQEKTHASDFIIVEYTISTSGSVSQPRVIATTLPTLNKTILGELAKWEFDERSKNSRVRQRILFR